VFAPFCLWLGPFHPHGATLELHSIQSQNGGASGVLLHLDEGKGMWVAWPMLSD
jgi:hypothetical protein